MTGSKIKKSGVEVTYEDGDGTQKLTVDRLIVAVGRQAETKDLIASDAGVVVDDRGLIEVNEVCENDLCGSLRGWRRRSWSDACAQGDGRGSDGCRADCRRQTASQLRNSALG